MGIRFKAGENRNSKALPIGIAHSLEKSMQTARIICDTAHKKFQGTTEPQFNGED